MRLAKFFIGAITFLVLLGLNANADEGALNKLDCHLKALNTPLSVQNCWEKVGKQILHDLAGDDLEASLGITPKIRIVFSMQPNAYALKSGTIILTSGLLDLLETRTELAFILAHETAHIVLGHSDRNHALSGSNRAFNIGLENEHAADQYAWNMLSQRGLSPIVSVPLLERLQNFGNSEGFSVKRIYPSLSMRIDTLRSHP